MKVCNISAQGYTGIAYYDHSFSNSLQEAGVETVLVTSRQRLVQPVSAPYEVKLFFVNTYGSISRFRKGISYILGMLRTYFYVLRKKIPIVHFQLLELPMVDIWFFRLFRCAGVKIVYTPHDIFNFKFSLNDGRIKQFFALSDRVCAHNTANMELLKERFGLPESKLRLIRQGNMNDFLDPALTREKARRQIGLPLDKKIILFFGIIREGKGAETAARAVAQLPDKKNILFVMAGKPMRGYDMSALEGVLGGAQMSGCLEKRFRFIEDKDVEAYYKAADVVVIPYERIYTSAVICYAFSCGCASVVSSVREFADFARDEENCLVFEVGNPQDLAGKLERLLADETLCQRLAVRAKRLADTEWDWRRTAVHLKKIYQEILEAS